MNRCKTCGERIPDRARFCPACGAVCAESEKQTDVAAKDRAGGAAPVNPNGRKRRKKKRLAMLVAALVALVAIIAGVIALVKGCGEKTAVQSYPATADEPAYTSQFADADPAASRLEIPDVTGMTLFEAQRALEQLGLVVDAAASGYDSAYGDSAVLTQSKAAGEWAQSGDHIALTYNALPLTLNVFAFSPREGRITLGNLIEVCSALGTRNPTVAFSIVIHAGEEYELKGGFRCLTGANEETPIARVNTQLLREGKAIQGLVAENAYDDSVGWTVSLDDWTGFHFDNVTGYDVTISSREDASLMRSRSYLPAETKSMTLLNCGFDGGSIRLDVTSQKQLVIRLADDKLQTGYTNSATPGSRTPVWQIKLPMNSYQWIAATVDGSGGEPIDGMRASGKQFIETANTAKGVKPSSFDGVSYSVDGDTLVVSVTVPDELNFSFYEIEWLELTMGDGAATFKTRIR